MINLSIRMVERFLQAFPAKKKKRKKGMKRKASELQNRFSDMSMYL